MYYKLDSRPISHCKHIIVAAATDYYYYYYRYHYHYHYQNICDTVIKLDGPVFQHIEESLNHGLATTQHYTRLTSQLQITALITL